jgi:hypothetical protein
VITPNRDVARREVDGHAALVGPDGVEILELDPAHAAVWDALAADRDRSLLGDDPETSGVLEELDALGLVSDEGSTRRLTVLTPEPPQDTAAALRREAAEGPLQVDVTGGSMRPLVRPGDRVQIDGAADRRPRWGEMWALCHHTGLVVVLRCRARRRNGFVFQGDAEHRAAALVPPEHLVGRVVAVERDGGGRALGAGDRWSRGVTGQLRYGRRRLATRVRRATRS